MGSLGLQLEAAAEEVEGLLGGGVFEGFPVVRQVAVVDFGGALGIGEADKDSAHGFFWGAAGGSGDAGEGQGMGGLGQAEGGIGEGAGAGFADGAVLLEEIGGDAEGAFLGLVGIGDPASPEDLGSTRHVGESVGEKAAGAGFDDGQAGVLRSGQVEDDVFQALVAIAKDPGAQSLTDG